MPALTISRQMGSLGDEVAAVLADRLGWDLIDRNEAIDRFLAEDATPADRHLLRESARHFLAPSPSGLTFIERIEQGLRDFLSDHPAVLVGFGSRSMFADDRAVLNVRVVASRSARIARVRQRFHVPSDEAERILVAADRKQRRFIATVFGDEPTDPVGYDLVLNTTKLTVDEAAAAVLPLLEKLRARIAAETELPLEALAREVGGARAAAPNGAGRGRAPSPEDVSPFKHPSEAEFARILDMYGIEWTYEPRSFPLEWDDQGRVVQAFRPDFHLTRFGTYLELTTMDQKHVTEKNRKLKRLRELYPDIDVRIVYRKDFRSLLERFRAAEPR